MKKKIFFYNSMQMSLKEYKNKYNISNYEPDDPIVIYTDGACCGKGDNRSAGIGLFWEKTKFFISEPLECDEKHTNNTGELKAILKIFDHEKVGDIVIKSDSKYCVNALSSWAAKWIKNDWRKSDGEKVLNREIIEQILNAFENHIGSIYLKHVTAHSGNLGNEMADTYAVLASQTKKSSQGICANPEELLKNKKRYTKKK